MKKQKTNTKNEQSVPNVILRFFEPNFEPDDLEKKDLNLHITVEVEVLSFGNGAFACPANLLGQPLLWRADANAYVRAG
jgi:hypothetical protein